MIIQVLECSSVIRPLQLYDRSIGAAGTGQQLSARSYHSLITNTLTAVDQEPKEKRS